MSKSKSTIVKYHNEYENIKVGNVIYADHDGIKKIFLILQIITIKEHVFCSVYHSSQFFSEKFHFLIRSYIYRNSEVII